MSTPDPLAIAVRDLADDPRLGLRLTRLAGEAGLDRPVRHARVQKSGLALAGHLQGVVPTRVQVLGETELSYLDALEAGPRGEAARTFFALGLSCVVVTRRAVPRAVVLAAEASGTPLFASDARSSTTINALHAVLDERLAPTTDLHGVLVDVFGVGLLLLGKSGIGKSEAAVELVLRGHRLVADDMVRCSFRPPGMVFGQAPELLRNHVEIRGLGILNIRQMFGITSVRDRKRIDVVVQLEDFVEGHEYDRLGLDERAHTILGVNIRLLTVPVRPGRDMGTILEMAARNELVRRAGHHAARELLGQIDARTVPGAPPSRPLPLTPESIVPPEVREGPSRVPPAPNSSVARPGWDRLLEAGPGESAAFIPAVRRIAEDE